MVRKHPKMIKEIYQISVFALKKPNPFEYVVLFCNLHNNVFLRDRHDTLLTLETFGNGNMSCIVIIITKLIRIAERATETLASIIR